MQDIDPPKKPKRNKYALGRSILASTVSILQGYDLGVISFAANFIKDNLNVSDVKIKILVEIMNLYCLIGAACAGRTSDWIGRRYTIVIAAGIFFVGALLMGFATDYAFLMIGRFITSFGVGYAVMIAPVYTTEFSPASSRGFLASIPELFINIGIILGFVSCYAFSNLPAHLGWRFMLGMGAVPSVFLAFFTMFALPESPRWLVMQGRLGDARRVLDKTSDSKDEARLRLADIKEAAGIPETCNDDVVSVPKGSHGEGVWRDLFVHPAPPIRHILIAAVGIHFFQQASGIDLVFLYSPRIFAEAGMTDVTHMLEAMIAIGLTKAIFVLVATFFLDKIGRRPLLLYSVAGMILSLILLGTALTIINKQHDDDKGTWSIPLCITTLLIYVACFSMGLGPITIVYSSEIFPLRLRAQGFSLVVAVNRATSSVIYVTFMSLYKSITLGKAFFLFTGIASMGWVFFYTMIPETRGENLEEVGRLFGHIFKWKWRPTILKNLKDMDDQEISEIPLTVGG